MALSWLKLPNLNVLNPLGTLVQKQTWNKQAPTPIKPEFQQDYINGKTTTDIQRKIEDKTRELGTNEPQQMPSFDWSHLNTWQWPIAQPLPQIQSPMIPTADETANKFVEWLKNDTSLNIPELPVINPTEDTTNIPWIDKVSAGETITDDVLWDLKVDIDNGKTLDQIKQAYPEFSWNDELIGNLTADIKNGADIPAIKQAYPEIFWQQEIQEVTSTEKPEESLLDKFKPKSSESFTPAELWKDVFKFFANVPADSAELVWGLWDVVTSPIETTKWIIKTWKWLSDTAVYWIANWIMRAVWSKEVAPTDEMKMIDTVASNIKENYWTAGKFKKAIVENPADTLLTIMWGLWMAGKLAKAKGFVDVANKIDKINEVINPINIIKQEAKIATVIPWYTWTWMKKVWEFLYKTAIKPNAQEAEKILKFKAWLWEAPNTVAETAFKSWVAWTETRIWVQWLKKADEIFKKTVEPAFNKSTTEHSLSDMFNSAEKRIDSMNTWELRKSELKEWLQALKEDYSLISKDKFTTKELNQEKSSLDEFTPDKVFKGKQVASSYNQAKNILANVFRDTVHKDLWSQWIKSQEAFRDYANLKELSKIWVKWLTDSWFKGGFWGFWTTMYEQATTPIKTIGWQILYKVWDKLEFIWPKGINKLWDFIKDKISVAKDWFLNHNQK